MPPYNTTFSVKRLWQILIAGTVVMFSVLLYFGGQIYQQAPPIPDRYETGAGRALYTRADIELGQNVWQSLGGMQQGSIWGHGSYLAPDWSADWLHREAEALRDILANGESANALHDAEVRRMMRTNTYDVATDTVTIDDDRAEAIAQVASHFKALFEGNTELQELRKAYAFPINVVTTPSETHALNAFFFWSSWSAVTNRPDSDISYTSNWPHDPLVSCLIS